MDGIERPEHGSDARAVRSRALPGTLYVVATPLGNLRDLTLRALDVLGSADIVAAEDTRVTSVLLRYYGIATRLVSVHEHSEARRAAEIVDLLRAGKSVALVADAGTPAVSAPGARMVRAVRDAGFAVVPVPGANAAVAAVSAAGLATERFVFVGFLPTTAKARRELLDAFRSLPVALVVYESPRRVRTTVAALAQALGGERMLVVAREVTKQFETIARMPLAEAASWFAADADRERGEFVLLVDAAPDARFASAGGAAIDARTLLVALLAELPPTKAARIAAEVTGRSRDALYAEALLLKGN